MKIIKSVYDFVVGDMIILLGILITVVILALIASLGALAPLRIVEGPLLIVAVLAVLVATLSREVRSHKR